MRLLQSFVIIALCILFIFSTLAYRPFESIYHQSRIVGRTPKPAYEGHKVFMDHTYAQMIKAHRSYTASIRASEEALQPVINAQNKVNALGESPESLRWQEARKEEDDARRKYLRIADQQSTRSIDSHKSREQALKTLVKLKTLNKDLYNHGSDLFKTAKAATILSAVRKESVFRRALQLVMANEHARRAAAEHCCKMQIEKYRHTSHIEENCINVFKAKFLPRYPDTFNRAMSRMWKASDQARTQRSRAAFNQGLKAVAHHRALCVASILNRDLREHRERLDNTGSIPDQLRVLSPESYLKRLFEPDTPNQECGWCRRTKFRLQNHAPGNADHSLNEQGLLQQNSKESVTSFTPQKNEGLLLGKEEKRRTIKLRFRPKGQRRQEHSKQGHIDFPDYRKTVRRMAPISSQSSSKKDAGLPPTLLIRSDSAPKAQNDGIQPSNKNTILRQGLQIFIENEAKKMTTFYRDHLASKKAVHEVLQKLNVANPNSTLINTPGAFFGGIIPTGYEERRLAASKKYIDVFARHNPAIEAARLKTDAAFKNLLSLKKSNKDLRNSVTALLDRPAFKEDFAAINDGRYKAYVADKALKLFLTATIPRFRAAAKRVWGGGGGVRKSDGDSDIDTNTASASSQSQEDLIYDANKNLMEYHETAAAISRVMFINKGLLKHAVAPKEQG